MTGRDGSTQASPGRLDGFPASQCSGTYYRSTQATYSDFGYFSSGGGRFDLEAPRGTLYLGRSIHAAVMERVAAPESVPAPRTGLTRRRGALLRKGKVGEAEARGILVWTVKATRQGQLANLTARDAATYGVTNELSGGPSNYDLTQEWAAAFDAAGFDGIEYNSRYVTSKASKDNAIASFGGGGENNGSFVSVREPQTLDEVAREAGIGIRRTGVEPSRLVGDL